MEHPLSAITLGLLSAWGSASALVHLPLEMARLLTSSAVLELGVWGSLELLQPPEFGSADRLQASAGTSLKGAFVWLSRN
jgi:hypothetical protein